MPEFTGRFDQSATGTRNPPPPHPTPTAPSAFINYAYLYIDYTIHNYINDEVEQPPAGPAPAARYMVAEPNQPSVDILSTASVT